MDRRLYSYVTSKPAIFFIEAIENSEIIFLSKEQKELLYEKAPKFERFFRMQYQNSLASHIRRVNQDISLTAEERYLNFKKKLLYHRKKGFPKAPSILSRSNPRIFKPIKKEIIK